MMDRLKKDKLQWECFYTSYSITLLIQIENHTFRGTYLWCSLKDCCSLTAEMNTLPHGLWVWKEMRNFKFGSHWNSVEVLIGRNLEAIFRAPWTRRYIEGVSWLKKPWHPSCTVLKKLRRGCSSPALRWVPACHESARLTVQGAETLHFQIDDQLHESFKFVPVFYF